MSGKIFIVEDDESTVLLIETMLKKEGFTVRSMTTSIGAAGEISRFRPDVIILDIMIPDFSGDALAELISENIRPRPKIIFYSSKTPGELFKLVQEKGVDGYICKTDGPKALVNKVKSILKGGQ